MVRFLLVLAAVAAYTSVYLQPIKLIITAQVESGKQLYASGKYAKASKVNRIQV